MKTIIKIDKMWGAVTIEAVDDQDQPLPETKEASLFVWGSLMDASRFWYNYLMKSVDQLDILGPRLDAQIESIKDSTKIYKSAQELIDDRFKPKEPEPPATTITSLLG